MLIGVRLALLDGIVHLDEATIMGWGKYLQNHESTSSVTGPEMRRGEAFTEVTKPGKSELR